MPSCTDHELAGLVSQELAGGAAEVMVAANGYQARLFARPSPASSWTELGIGDLDEETAKVLQPVARKKSLYWLDVHDPVEAADNAVVPTVATARTVARWRARRDKLTKLSGRQGEVSAKTQREVESSAAWHCQFDGCGADLHQHPTDNRQANYSYLAHIIPSSADGPRGGDAQLSALLADDPSNIMLLCDKCHRLVDRVGPKYYDAERLRGMRERNIGEVKRLLGTLSFPTAHMVVVGGYIEGQSAGFNQRFAEQAMWGRRLRAANTEPFWFLRNGGNLPDSTHEQYWGGLFQTLTSEVASLQGYLNGTSRGGPPCNAVALFPTHVTSIQILAGRIVGNATTVHLFQPNRNASPNTPGERWAWPSDAPTPSPDKYHLKTLISHSGQQDAALLVYLTAPIDEAELPAQVAAAMPVIELRAKPFGHSVIGTEKDLEVLALHFDTALRQLQDEWRVRRIHLVAVAPASACVLLGQKLQARHHSNVVVYERKRVSPGQARGPFVPTIEISKSEVQLVGTTHRVPLG